MANTAASRPPAVLGLSLTDPRCADVLNALPGLAAPATPAAIPADRLSTVLGAFNASNLASSYIERGNFTAARRKLVQALNAVNQLQSGLSSAGVQAKGGTA